MTANYYSLLGVKPLAPRYSKVREPAELFGLNSFFDGDFLLNAVVKLF
jgi:hypothetical protein